MLMKLKYIDSVTIKLVIAFIITIIAIPYWFYSGGTLLGFILVRLVANHVQATGTIGYHRWLCHNSFKPNVFGKYFMLFGIMTSGIGRPFHYVISHMLHHRHTDTELDPQSPKYLTFWELFWGRLRINSGIPVPKHFMRNKEAMFVNTYYWHLYFSFNIILAIIDLPTALIFCPITLVQAWMGATVLNYHGHAGYKNKDEIQPTNLPTWINILPWSGENLHKNHHENPSSYHFDGNGRKDIMRWYVEGVLMSKKQNV